MLKILKLKTGQDKSTELFSGHYSKIFDLIATIDIIDPENGHFSVRIWFANVNTLNLTLFCELLFLQILLMSCLKCLTSHDHT